MPNKCLLIPFGLLVLLIAGGATSQADDKPAQTTARKLTFDDIRPLLQAKCWRCHGEKAQKAELDLTAAAKILKGGESGSAVIAGKPEKSPLFEKVHDGSMPPGKKDRLGAADVDLLRRWIVDGAKSETIVTKETALTQDDAIPILMRHCTACHGTRRQEGGLDLRTKSAMLKGGKSGPAFIPGKPADSLLLKRIHAVQMPPRERMLEEHISYSVSLSEGASGPPPNYWCMPGAPGPDAK